MIHATKILRWTFLEIFSWAFLILFFHRPWDKDRYMSPDIASATSLLKEEKIWNAAKVHMEYYHSAQVSVPTEYFAIKELNCRKFLDFEALLKFGQDQIGKWKASKFAAGHPDKNSSTITDVKQPELNQQSVGYQQDLVQNKSTRYFLLFKGRWDSRVQPDNLHPGRGSSPGWSGVRPRGSGAAATAAAPQSTSSSCRRKAEEEGQRVLSCRSGVGAAWRQQRGQEADQGIASVLNESFKHNFAFFWTNHAETSFVL